MKALVTGVTGFIGGALAAALVQTGWQVTAIVRPPSRDRLPEANHYRVIEADLARDSSSLGEAVRGCDLVFHAAAIRDRWGTSFETYRQTNVEGTRRLLAAAVGHARRFVYISSVGVHGAPGQLGTDETYPIQVNAGKVGYHSTKAEAEQVVIGRSREIETVVVRPTITYGPGDRDGMLTRLIDLIARGRFLRIGQGRNCFHLTYIDDLVEGLLLAGTHPTAAGQVFILSGSEPIRVGDMIAMIERSLGWPQRYFYLPEEPARAVAWSVEMIYRVGKALTLPGFDGAPLITQDKIDTLCLHRGYSSQKAERLLGYTPLTGYEDGLDNTLAWMAATNRLHFAQKHPLTHSTRTTGLP